MSIIFKIKIEFYFFRAETDVYKRVSQCEMCMTMNNKRRTALTYCIMNFAFPLRLYMIAAQPGVRIGKKKKD